MKEARDILYDFQLAWTNSIEQRDKVVQDQKFVDVYKAQWEGRAGEQFCNKPKPEFDKISREINRIIGEYDSNPIGIRFLPDDEEAEQEIATILEDRYRNDSRRSNGQESTDNAFAEAVKGGFGAFRLSTQFENQYDPDHNKQFVSFDPILSAASTVIWDDNATNFDKSDATQCWVLHEMTTRKFNEEYAGKTPFQAANGLLAKDYTFDWYNTSKVYTAEYYEVVEKKKKRIVFETPEGERVKYFKDELKDDDIAFEVSFYEQVSVETVKVRVIEKALMSGDSFLSDVDTIAGSLIPIIPVYGYRSYIEGKEYYMGEVRKQRDRQTFYNMSVSMLQQLMTESQKEKDIFDPSQMTPAIAAMWADDNIENHPYLLAKALRDQDGNIKHLGPVGKTSAPQIPQALAGALALINQDFAEELGTGELNIPANTANAAIQTVNQRADMSYFILIHNMRKSMKYAARVFLGMNKEILNVSRTVRTVSEDGSVNTVEMLETGFNEQGLQITKNNPDKGNFEVVAETGASYSSKMEAERATINAALLATDSNHPMYGVLLSELMQTMEGSGASTIRKVARFQELAQLLSISPILLKDELKNDEEKEYVMSLLQQQQQQGQQEDPAMKIAQGEFLKGQAAVINAQTDQANLQLKAIDTESTAVLNEAKTVKTYAEAEDINAKRTQEAIKMVSGIRRDNAKEMSERLRNTSNFAIR